MSSSAGMEALMQTCMSAGHEAGHTHPFAHNVEQHDSAFASDDEPTLFCENENMGNGGQPCRRAEGHLPLDGDRPTDRVKIKKAEALWSPVQRRLQVVCRHVRIHLVAKEVRVVFGARDGIERILVVERISAKLALEYGIPASIVPDGEVVAAVEGR
jgi:hypothetical protein